MIVGLTLWLADVVLATLTLVTVGRMVTPKVIRARRERLGFLGDAIKHLELLPQADDIKHAWHTILSRPVSHSDDTDLVLCAIYALEQSYDAAVDALRDVVVPQVNLINKFAELVDEGLVRPKDVARLYPDIHFRILSHLALIEPFIWYESIFQGRGRWGYRALRLKTVFERLRPIAASEAIRSPLVLEICGLFFQALPSVTSLERIWAVFYLSVRSPTITSRSKVAQVAHRDYLKVKLRDVGLAIVRGAGQDKAVDW